MNWVMPSCVLDLLSCWKDTMAREQREGCSVMLNVVHMERKECLML